MPTWPASLPQFVEVGDYQESPPATKIRSPMDASPPKMRRRFTAGVRPLRVKIMLPTKAQVETLDSFHETTLAGGTLSFDWVHPRTQVAKTFRFVSEPRYSPKSPEGWYAHLDLEVLP
jgi:hypothetical protein